MLRTHPARYRGQDEIRTRGEYGEEITEGVFQDGYIYVWDDTFGWTIWSRTGPDWDVDFSTTVPRVPEQW